MLLDLPLDLDDYRRPEHGIGIMDVGAWLRSLGLAQYEALFRQNDIDAEVLGDLTDADLEKLGLTLGHRKRLLKAIASLDGTELVAKPTSPASPSLSTDAAERRPITIMFCDLVGSTNLAARLDAEDWRNLVGAYLDAASAAVTGLGGHVLKKLGDGLMALFGYPHAQENDAERAVRAALAIQRALADLNARNARSGAPELSARIGIEMRALSWSTLPAKCSAMRRTSRRGCRRRPNRGRCSLPRACSGRLPGCSSPRTEARMSSGACRRRSRSTASFGRAAAAGAAGRAR